MGEGKKILVLADSVVNDYVNRMGRGEIAIRNNVKDYKDRRGWPELAEQIGAEIVIIRPRGTEDLKNMPFFPRKIRHVLVPQLTNSGLEELLMASMYLDGEYSYFRKLKDIEKAIKLAESRRIEFKKTHPKV